MTTRSAPRRAARRGHQGLRRRCTRSGASTSRSSPARWWRSSGPTAPARPRPSTWCSGSPGPPAARSTCSGCSRARRSPAGWSSAVMQTGGLLKDLTVRETVAYTASLFADTKPVDEVLARAGITGIADRKVAKCSGGEQQRLRFAMALLSDPALLLLDEPTTGMDVEGRRAFWSAIRAGRRPGPHGAVRHPLPRGGRPVRRPDRAGQPRPHRRRRHRRRDQGAGLRPDRARHAARRGHRRPSRRSPASTASRCAATRSRARQGQRRRRPLPAHRDRRPRPRGHRAGPRGSLPQPDRPPTTTSRARRDTDDHRPPRPRATAPGAAAGRVQPHRCCASSCAGCCATGAR